MRTGVPRRSAIDYEPPVTGESDSDNLLVERFVSASPKLPEKPLSIGEEIQGMRDYEFACVGDLISGIPP